MNGLMEKPLAQQLQQLPLVPEAGEKQPLRGDAFIRKARGLQGELTYGRRREFV